MRFRLRSPLRFLLALVVAITLWYALAGQRRESISVRSARAALTLVNLPPGLVLTSDVPDVVLLRLSGPQSRIIEVDERLEVLLDLSDAQPGLLQYPITADAITLPAEISVVGFVPDQVTLELERLATRRLPLEPQVEGVPAPGFMVTTVAVNPDQVVLSGPASRLGALDLVMTEPVSVEGASSALQADVQMMIEDALIRPVAVEPILVAIQIVPIPDSTPTPTR